MLVKKSVIEKDSKKCLSEYIESYFQYKEGNDLASIIDEVLHSREIFTFFALHFKPSQGLKLGQTRYYDDTIVYVHYGLMLDFRNIPRELKLFSYESFDIVGLGDNKKLSLGRSIPDYRGQNCDPDPEIFVSQVNEVLKNPKNYLVKLDLKSS